MDRANSLTTPEAARQLGLPIPEARLLLRCVGADRERIGAAYLWDASTVARLAAALAAREVRRG